MRVDVRLLGGFEVLVDRERLSDDAWRRRSTASLVKLLALARGHRLRREQVIDALWPDLLVERAAPRLHKAAHYARGALGSPEGLVLSGDVVALFPEAEVTVDVELFDARVEAARAGGQLGPAAEAVELYRGELLPDDVYEPWTEEARERIGLAYVEMLHVLGRWDVIVAVDPLDETAHLQLAKEHVQRGDRRAALHQLEVMEKVWERELGLGLGGAALALRVEALDLPVEAVAVPASALAPVPLPPTPTVGRELDIEAVLEMVERSRTVTLLGPGGVGKTRLAAEVALRHSADTSVESCFVDLTKVSDPALVPGLLARELGIRVGAGGDAEQVLAEALRRRSILLVLDNFEHVLDAAELVSRLAQWSLDLKVLSTSRARLHVAGEQIFDVSPLSVERTESSQADAVALFEQVATGVDPLFRLEQHRDDVESICRAIDGLPLAIELAAGHVRTLPPPLLLARLGARLSSAAAATRGVPARQRTVAATIDWSLQLLDEAEQDLFRNLGVFAGAVPLEAVEQVCGAPGVDVVDSLSRLVDHSLVRRVVGRRGEPRFVLLELLRERARELLALDPSVEKDLVRRHAAYVVEFLDDLDESRWSTTADRWIDLVTGHLGEIRLAHARSVDLDDRSLAARIVADLGTYWHREGHHEEGRQWATAALEHQADLDDYLVARIHLSAGFVEWTQDQALGREHWEESVRRFRTLGDDRYLAYALSLMAVTYLGEEENRDLARRLCDEGTALARVVGERPLLAQALNIRGELARTEGDDEAALAAYLEGLELATAAGDEVHASMFLGNLSFLAEHRGDYEEAWRLSREALQLSWATGSRLTAAFNCMEIAGPELGLGRPERSARLLGAGMDTMRRLGVGMHPGDWAEHERIVAALEAELGGERLEVLVAEGAQMTIEEAVALVFSDGESPTDQVRRTRSRR